jgi:hypothetical protein
MRSFKSSCTRQGDWQKLKTPTNGNEDVLKSLGDLANFVLVMVFVFFLQQT